MFINWVWRTHCLALSHSYSSARPVKAASGIRPQICQHKRPLVHEPLTHGTENLEESRARFISWQPDATVHSPPVGCQMDTYFHGGYLAINWTQAVAEWMWGRVVLSPACTLLFPLSEAGTQQSAKRASEKPPAVSCHGWEGLTMSKISTPRTSISDLLVKKCNFESAHTILI